jgi:hypothetical protein
MMKCVALPMLVLLTASYPAMAKRHHGHHYVARTIHHGSSGERESHSGITCEMVRAYVAQVGLAQAAAIAESAGVTSSEKERAKRCLAQKS